jgi:excisionase family DNA binding protein
MAERMLKVNEVADMVRVDPETVRRWLRAGELRGVRVGPGRGSYRIPESEVERMLTPEPAETEGADEGED